jgi:plasmid maintenance system antidote protein VapI
MALRLSRAFDTTPDFWLNLQKNFDLWQAERESQEWKKVKPFPKEKARAKFLDHEQNV